MEKTPGRPIESSPNRKTQLSSDAKIIVALRTTAASNERRNSAKKEKSANEPSTESLRYWKNSK